MLDSMPDGFAHFEWIPGHMDTEDKKRKYQHLLDSGQITSSDIEGNQYADLLAEKGANMHIVPPEILVYSHDRADFTKIV